jgi:AcrR family transcriptional regulator
MELADAEGLPAVTMRRLGATMGVEAMSLYHYLSGKQALLDGLVEEVLTEILDAVEAGHRDARDDWQATLRRRFLTARSVMLRHPWAPGLFGSRTTIPPRLYAFYEALLATMVEAGFSYHLAHRALHSFGSMPLGFVQELFSPTPTGGDLDAAQAEADMAELAATMPHLSAMVASEVHANDGDMLGWCDSQAEFEFTLDLLLEGFARRLA